MFEALQRKLLGKKRVIKSGLNTIRNDFTTGYWWLLIALIQQESPRPPQPTTYLHPCYDWQSSLELKCD